MPHRVLKREVPPDEDGPTLEVKAAIHATLREAGVVTGDVFTELSEGKRLLSIHHPAVFECEAAYLKAISIQPCSPLLLVDETKRFLERELNRTILKVSLMVPLMASLMAVGHMFGDLYHDLVVLLGSIVFVAVLIPVVYLQLPEIREQRLKSQLARFTPLSICQIEAMRRRALESPLLRRTMSFWTQENRTMTIREEHAFAELDRCLIYMKAAMTEAMSRGTASQFGSGKS